tara:strand:+ start:314 stop:517 length:204 start_codon:yes stop_codon:yes gene_type:complete
MKSLLPIGKNIVKVIPSIKNAEKKLKNQNIVISYNSVRDNTKELYNKEIQIKKQEIKGEINNLLYLP